MMSSSSISSNTIHLKVPMDSNWGAEFIPPAGPRNEFRAPVVIHGSISRPLSQLMMRAAEDAAGVEAIVGEDAGCEITGLAHLADGENRLAAVELVQTAAQLA